MKKILCVIVLLLFSVTVQAMTPIEFQKIGTGDIVTLNLEWNGKVYLQGDSVVAFKQGDSAWVASINPLNNFSGSFHCGYLTLVKSNQETADVATLKTRISQLESVIDGLKKIIVSFISQYGAQIKVYDEFSK